MTKQTFYEERIKGKNLKSLIKKDDTQITAPKESALMPGLEHKKIVSLEKENIITKDSINKCLYTLLEYFKAEVSFTRSYGFLKQINDFLETNPDIYLPDFGKFEVAFTIGFTEKADHKIYLEKMSEKNPSRNFDIGDRVRITYRNSELYSWGYNTERGRFFPPGLFGNVYNIHEYIEVYFEGHELPNWSDRIKEHFAIRKNIPTAHYLDSELEFVPINRYDKDIFIGEADKLKTKLSNGRKRLYMST